ncbi:ash family protein [Escherichia coli]
MVGCMGAEQSAPGTPLTGYANPVQSTASEIGVSSVGLLNLTERTATWLLSLPSYILKLPLALSSLA